MLTQLRLVSLVFVVLFGFGQLGMASEAETKSPLHPNVQKVAEMFGLDPQIFSAECIQKVQSLMSFEAWTQTPMAENITAVQKICLGVGKETPSTLALN